MVDIEDEDGGTNPEALASSDESKGLRVSTGQSSSEEFLNEYKFLNIEKSTGNFLLSDEDLDGIDDYACDTNLRTVRFEAFPSRNHEILYIVKYTIDENSMTTEEGAVRYREREKNAATFQKGGWLSVREI